MRSIPLIALLAGFLAGHGFEFGPDLWFLLVGIGLVYGTLIGFNAVKPQPVEARTTKRLRT